jgi:hypothetical protein
MELLTFASMFCCLGMVQQQQDDLLTRYKRNLNVTFNLCVIWQRALVIPLRNRFGVEALGLPCFLALILLFLWSGFSGDIFMWVYTGIWFVFFAHRRVQSLRMQQQVNSQYDGWPVDAIKICNGENMAKLVIEPVMVGFAGAFALWFYDQQGWRPTGLPYFLICGAMVLVFVEMAKQTAWKRRIRGMNDARMEQEQMVREFHKQYRR